MTLPHILPTADSNAAADSLVMSLATNPIMAVIILAAIGSLALIWMESRNR